MTTNSSRSCSKAEQLQVKISRGVILSALETINTSCVVLSVSPAVDAASISVNLRLHNCEKRYVAVFGGCICVCMCRGCKSAIDAASISAEQKRAARIPNVSPGSEESVIQQIPETLSVQCGRKKTKNKKKQQQQERTERLSRGNNR